MDGLIYDCPHLLTDRRFSQDLYRLIYFRNRSFEKKRRVFEEDSEDVRDLRLPQWTNAYRMAAGFGPKLSSGL
jgi:hypothetical protein